MQHWLKLVLLLMLVATISLAKKDPKAEKDPEGTKSVLMKTRAPYASQAAVGFWDSLAVTFASYQYDDVFATPGGSIWLGGWVIGTDEDFTLRSTDNGTTWNRSSLISFTNSAGYALAVRNADIALAATWLGDIYRTTDGGTTWNKVYTYGGGTGFFNGVAFTGGDSAMAVGDADASGLCVVKSTDAGATWTRFTNLPTAEQAVNIISSASYHQCMDGIGPNVWISTYVGSGSAPRLLRTTDFGVTWTSAAVTLTGGTSNAYQIRSINMASTSVGWLVPRQTASGVRAYVHKTTDGGATWSDTIRVELGSVVKAVKPVRGTNNLLAVGYKGNDPKAWWSTDGTTWTDISPVSSIAGNDLTNAYFVSNTLGYVVGINKALKFTPPVTGVNPEPSDLPASFALGQNFPNPFNPATTIRYTIPQESFVSLKVFDLLGRTVATVDEGMKNAGDHTVSFDAASLPSGVYVYALKAGSFTATRKMVLLK